MPHMVDMARSNEEDDSSPLVSNSPEKYPYGLRICLTHEELEKLNVDHTDWSVGEIFHLHAFAKVVAISTNEDTDGNVNCSVNLQITHLSGESEDAENEAEEESDEPSLEKFGYLRYNK